MASLNDVDNWIFLTPPDANGDRLQGVVVSSTPQAMILYLDQPVLHAESISMADTIGFLFFPNKEEMEKWVQHENPKTDPEPDKTDDPKVTKLKPKK